MNWTTEVPKESGWYWVKPIQQSLIKEVVYLAPNLKSVWTVSDPTPLLADSFRCWGEKLEIPE